MQLKLFTTFSLHSQYNIKKKEEIVEQAPPEPDNPLMRKKKTPEELAAEAEAEDLDDFTSEYSNFVKLSLFFRIFGIFSHFINPTLKRVNEPPKLGISSTCQKHKSCVFVFACFQ